MKYLLILFVLLTVGGYLYWRLRPYLAMARRALGFVRDMRRMNVNQAPADISGARRQPDATQEKLVRCSACGTWTPSSRAVSLRSSSSSYCSTDCLERAADSPRRINKSAS